MRFSWAPLTTMVVSVALAVNGQPIPARASAPVLSDAVLNRARTAIRVIPGDLPESLHYLTFASSKSPLSELVAGASSDPVEAAYPVFQIRYRHGWIMVDAGMDRDVDTSVSFQSERYALVQRALLDANSIVVTHEHHDHVAGVVRGETGKRVAQKTVLTRNQVQTLLDRPNLPTIRLTVEEAARYLVIDYDTLYPLAPGVVLIKAPGHTPGSQLLYVRLNSGQEALLIGDVVWNMAGLEGPRQKPESVSRELDEDRTALQQQMEWVGGLKRRNDISVIPCHDKEWLALLERRGVLKQGLDLRLP